MAESTRGDTFLHINERAENEASAPDVFADHRIRGTTDLWGRVQTYKAAR